MSRDLTLAMQTAIADGVIRPVTMVRLALDIGLIAVHSGVGSFSWNGDTYLGVGNFGSLSEIRESGDVAPNGVTATLSGIPTEYLAIAVGDHYQGREAIVYKALLDDAHELIADPALAFRGRIDYAEVQIGTTAAIALVIQSRLADWNRPRIRRYSHEDQQLRYPGDMGLEYVAKMVDKPLIWGR